MKSWIIAFQYWQIVFCKRGHSVPHLDPNSNFAVTTDADLPHAIQLLVEGKQDVWVWCEGDMRTVVSYFMQHYKYIKAAGGVVSHSAEPDRRLLIYRNEHWDMAKGKVEPGETLRQAAVREVEEETGLSIAQSNQLIVKTYHIYNLYGGWHLKQTSWYSMQDSGSRAIIPQQEEGITKAEWVSPQEFSQRLESSYSMMRLIANRIHSSAGLYTNKIL